MEFWKMQLADTFKSMKEKGLVDDQFTFVYSLKDNVKDHFYVEIIPEFCCDVQDGLKVLKQIMNDKDFNYKLMKEYVYKIKGGCLSFGACGMTQALIEFERAIDAGSKEECLKALKQAQSEFTDLEEKLHDCLKLERRLVVSATEETNM